MLFGLKKSTHWYIDIHSHRHTQTQFYRVKHTQADLPNLITSFTLNLFDTFCTFLIFKFTYFWPHDTFKWGQVKRLRKYHRRSNSEAFFFLVISRHPAYFWVTWQTIIIIIIIIIIINHYYYHVQGACSTKHTHDISLRRQFSLILTSTYISSQGLGWPEEQVIRHIPKCVVWRGRTTDPLKRAFDLCKGHCESKFVGLPHTTKRQGDEKIGNNHNWLLSKFMDYTYFS